MPNEGPPSEEEKRGEIFEDLKEQYAIVADRRRILSGQASSLLGFAGIIEAILIAALVSLGTDGDVRTLLITSSYRYLVVGFACIGFFSYIATAIFSLLAYYEPKWIPAPSFPVVRGKDLEHSVETYWERFPLRYDRKDVAKQLASGIEHNQMVNNSKYGNLKKASFTLMVGIIASIAGGIGFLLMSIEPAPTGDPGPQGLQGLT